ncbi:hypothetical protein H9Q13_17590 [Pontibacter sp. JH31]|uniref:Uncharacterized protein n=1 Tax=Pontibacter aquaedesilientis TaxID=2766980 RepID=A0ABR7XLX8_9BACT|nr:hypothetical protein [Pontibacter aquaedesilientis]
MQHLYYYLTRHAALWLKALPALLRPQAAPGTPSYIPLSKGLLATIPL